MADVLPPVPYDQPQTSFAWLDWYNKLVTLLNTGGIPHNDLPGLQGGTNSEYYHLTSAQHAESTATRGTRGIDTTDDIIIDLATKGLVLKDTQGTPHYWRVTIDNTGVLVTADLGTTKP